MKRLKRNEEGVSPVIATILMVAITVVLAATLWMMLDTDDDPARDFYGTLSVEDRGSLNDFGSYTRVDIGSISPSSVPIEDVTVTLYDAGDGFVTDLEGETGERADEADELDDFNLAWTRIDDELDDTGRLYVEYDDDEVDNIDGYEVEITVDGYSGSMNQEL